MSGDIAFVPVHRLAADIQARRLSPVDVVDALVERIRRHDPRLHAFVDIWEDEARLAAESADRAIRAGHGVGALQGVPVAIKDIVDIEGHVTTGGSAPWRDRVSPVTATLVRRMLSAGMIVLGKTHTVEFAMGGWGTNQHMGTPLNPWDPDMPRTPGGSSSGSGVAVAAGLAPWAIGTDTGGSVRLPASWCGIVGLKVAVGRISTWGVMPLSHSLDTPGPMVRSVEDAAWMLTILQGADPNDPKTLGLGPVDPFPALKVGLAGLTIGVLPQSERDGCDTDTAAAYESAIETCARQGARITEITLPRPLDELGGLAGRMIGAEGYYHVGDRVDDMSLSIDEAVRPRIWIGRGMSARDYLSTLSEQQAVMREFDTALAGVDVVAMPTTRTVAAPVAEVDQSQTPAHFTRVANVLDRPACAVPVGVAGSGLPTSVQFMGRSRDEATVLRAAWGYEQARGALDLIPPAFAN